MKNDIPTRCEVSPALAADYSLKAQLLSEKKALREEASRITAQLLAEGSDNGRSARAAKIIEGLRA